MTPSNPRPGREETAAVLVAIALVSIGAGFWLSNDTPPATCCPPTVRSLGAAIPADAGVRAGTLANGLRYFVRANNAPKQRAELRLVVNAGAVLEDDDQRGLAHAVEHMAFRGTRHFPRRAVVDYLQSIGMREGEDINARTTQDETVYRFTVPTDRSGVLDTAMAILADMAHEVSFDPQEARTEGGIVFAEWRSSRGARARLSRDRDALLLGDSRYTSRPTIGDTAVLRRFDVRAMRRFYDDWYRPELMAIVAVGDFDAPAVEQMIKKRFSALPPSATRRARPEIGAPRVMPSRAATLTDAEATSTRASLWFPRASVPRRRIADYRKELIDELWRDILNARLDDVADQPGSPLLSAGSDARQVVRPLDAEVVAASVTESGAAAAVDILAGEVARLAARGPTAREFKARSDALLRRRRQAQEYLDSSDDVAESFVDEFLTGDVALNRESSWVLARDLLPTIHAADVLAAARRMSIDSGALVLVTGPSRRALASVTPASLVTRARLATVRAAVAQVDVPDSVTLIEHPPEPGKVESEHTLAEEEAYDLTLSNGMRVILKPTGFVSDQIEFRLVGAGGASLASDADYPSAYLSDAVIGSTGVGPMTGTRLGRLLDASSIDLSPRVTDEAIEFSGSTAPHDLETLFQLLHLYFTSPRADASAFRRYRERVMAFVSHRSADPDAVFYDSVAVTTTQHHPRGLKSGAPFYSAVSLPRALAFWNARVSNASSFTLVVTGDFSLEIMRPLVLRYLGSLPGGARERSRDNGIRFPTGVVRRAVVAGVGPKAKTQIAFSGPFNNSSESSTALDAARDVAELALGERLRETLAGTYGVNVYSSFSIVPPARYIVTIEFEASPDRIDQLAEAALAELARLHTVGPTKAEVDKIRAAEVRDLDGKMESNSYWATELSTHARMGWPLTSIRTHQQVAKHLTVEGLRDACAKFLDASSYTRVTMYPQRAARATQHD
jgi:zinc protease